MAHVQKEYQKLKQRYDQGIQSEAMHFSANLSYRVISKGNHINSSDMIYGSVNAGRKNEHIERLIEGLERKELESRDWGEAVKKSHAEERRNVHLNMMRLKDKQFQLKGNVFNIAVGQIIDREAYLQKLNNEINQLKSKIHSLQEEENEQAVSSKIRVEEREKSANTIHPVLYRTSTIQQRKTYCGRFYSRVKTPSPGRSANFAKLGQASSYYKWRPKLDQSDEEKMCPISLLQNTPPRYSQAGQGRKKNGAELKKPISAYRLKHKNSSKAAMSEIECQTYLQNRETPQKNEKVVLKAKENPQKSGMKEVKNEELKEKKKDDKIGKHQAGEEKEQKVQPQLEPYNGVPFRQQLVPDWEISKIQQDFRAKMELKLQIPKGFPLPALEICQTFQEYEKLGPKIFELFGIQVQRQHKKVITRKFKNGVYYQLDRGKNVIWYYSGVLYFGEWEAELPAEGQKNGFGFQHVPNKYVYLGHFKEGMRHGQGTIKIFSSNPGPPEHFIGYQGQWAAGKPHGFGAHIDHNNTKYIGHFNAGEKTGTAIILTQDGLYYEGHLRNNLKHGLGFQRLPNGDTYTGMFIDGKFNGSGAYHWKNGSLYEGQFLNGKRQGKGRWKAPNGDEFEGEYFEDVKNGWGRFTWANGEIYEGEFRNDVRHGQGSYRHPAGKVGKFLWVQGQIQHRIYSKEEEEYRSRHFKDPQNHPQTEQIDE